MNIFKRVYNKLNAVAMITALTLGVGAALAMGSVSAQSCPTLGAPFDNNDNAVIDGGAPNIPTIQKAYGSNATVRDIYNSAPFNITTADINNLCTSTIETGTVTRGGDVYIGSKLVATNAITAGRDYISGSTAVTTNGFTFYKRPPSVGFAAGVQSLTVYVVMQNGQFQFAIMSACGNPVTGNAVPPAKGSLACTSLVLNTGSTDTKGNQTDTLTASATAANATISTYAFDFGNGKTQTIASAAGSVKSEAQTYAPGSYTAKVTVTGIAANIYSTAPDSVTCTVPIKVLPVGSLACTNLVLNNVSTDDKTGNVTYTLTASATANNATISKYTFNFGDAANTTQVVTTSATKATSKQFVYNAGQTYKNITATVSGTGANGAAVTSAACAANVTIPPQTCATGSTAESCQPTCVSPTNGQTYPVSSAQCQPTPPVTPPATPTALVNTGAGNTIALFFGATFAAAIAHRFFMKRRQAAQL